MASAAKLLETAAADLGAGRHGSAERNLKKLLKSRPRNPAARHLLGLVHLARGEPVPAARQFKLAVDAGAGTDAEVNLGLALAASEQWGEAERVLRAAVGKAPAHTGAAFNLGHLLRIAGSFTEAETLLRRTLELDGSHDPARLELGLALIETGAFDEARQCLATVLARRPDNEVAALNMARLDQRLGDFEAAIRGYRSLRESRAGGPEVELGLGACLQEQGSMEEALTHYRQLLGREPALYPRVLRALTGASRGVLPLRPSAARALLAGTRRL